MVICLASLVKSNSIRSGKDDVGAITFEPERGLHRDLLLAPLRCDRGLVFSLPSLEIHEATPHHLRSVFNEDSETDEFIVVFAFERGNAVQNDDVANAPLMPGR